MDKVIAVLNSIPETAWTAFGTALIAFFGVWLTNWNTRQSLKMQLEHEERLKRREIARERLEELYSQVNEWGHAMFEYYGGVERVLKGKQTAKEHFEDISKSPYKFEYCRIEMIIGVYGDRFQKAYDNAIAVRAQLSAMDDLITDPLGSSKVDVQLFESTRKQLNKTIKELKEAIVKATKEV